MIAGFIKIPFLPLCSKFTSDAFSQGRSFKAALLPPGRDPSPQGPALPPTQAREPPPGSPVCLSPLRLSVPSPAGQGRGQIPQREEPGAAVSRSPVLRLPRRGSMPRPGEAGRREAPVCRLCQSGPGTSAPPSPGPRRPSGCAAPPGGRGGRGPVPELPEGCS